MRSNRHSTVKKIVEDCNISVGLYHEILVEEHGMHYVAAKFISRFISQYQKESRHHLSKPRSCKSTIIIVGQQIFIKTMNIILKYSS